MLTAVVDYDSVVGIDKFDNLWMVRYREEAIASRLVMRLGIILMHARDYLHGAPSRLSLAAHVFTEDVLVSISKTGLVAGG